MSIVTEIKKTVENAERLNPELNNFLSIEHEHSLERATQLETSSDGLTLNGLAVAVKDNICTKGMNFLRLADPS